MTTVSLNINQKLLGNNRFLYLVEYLSDHPCLKNEVKFYFNHLSALVQIDYGKKGNGSFFIPSLDHFFFTSSSDYSSLNQVELHLEDSSIRVFAKKSSQERKPIVYSDFQFDLFENIFFHISRYEEVFCAAENKNQVGWLKEELQFLVRHNIQETPIVDRLVHHFLETIIKEQRQKHSTYQLTHDIDELYKFRPRYKIFRTIAGALFRRKDLAYLFDNVSLFLKSNLGKGKDPYDVFDVLIDSDKVWEKKVIYFMTGGDTEYDNKYNIHHPKVDEIIKLAQNRAYHIGIHPSYSSSIKLDFIKNERSILQKRSGSEIDFSRQHWLRFDWDKTPYYIEQEGIRQDSSMGYNRHLGFRCGTGFAYHLYDFKHEKKFEWLEQPMAFMESSLIHYCQDNNCSIVEIAEHFILNNKSNTCLCFNFHNSRFDTTTADGAALKNFYLNQLKSLLIAKERNL